MQNTIHSVNLTTATCFRCGNASKLQFFDGPGALKRRSICQPCEHGDWRATIRAMNAS